jgi:hypothetical protein
LTRFWIEQLIVKQLSFSLIGPLFDCAKRYVAHSKDENQWREWGTSSPQNLHNLLIINKLADPTMGAIQGSLTAETGSFRIPIVYRSQWTE